MKKSVFVSLFLVLLMTTGAFAALTVENSVTGERVRLTGAAEMSFWQFLKSFFSGGITGAAVAGQSNGYDLEFNGVVPNGGNTFPSSVGSDLTAGFVFDGASAVGVVSAFAPGTYSWGVSVPTTSGMVQVIACSGSSFGGPIMAPVCSYSGGTLTWGVGSAVLTTFVGNPGPLTFTGYVATFNPGVVVPPPVVVNGDMLALVLKNQKGHVNAVSGIPDLMPNFFDSPAGTPIGTTVTLIGPGGSFTVNVPNVVADGIGGAEIQGPVNVGGIQVNDFGYRDDDFLAGGPGSLHYNGFGTPFNCPDGPATFTYTVTFTGAFGDVLVFDHQPFVPIECKKGHGKLAK